MDLQEYADRQRSIAATLASLLLRILWPFRRTKFTDRTWPSVERAIYPAIERARRESTEVAREFYDSQRLEHVGSRRDQLLTGYKRSWLTEALRPVKKDFMKDGPKDGAITKLIMTATKEAENGGRRQILNAVRDEPRRIRWARVATGRETCAFCWMLISRGDAYLYADSAGLDTDRYTAEDLYRQKDFGKLDEMMVRWHPGCDCLAVPVFDSQNWPGKEAADRAYKIWRKVTKGYSGKDALNALRRAIDDGEIDPRDFSAIAA